MNFSIPSGIAATIFAMIALSSVQRIAARTWTDITGREIEAELINHDQNEVVLQLPNGKTATVPLRRFSEKDLAFLRGEGDEEPTAETEKESQEGAEAKVAADELNWNDPWPETIKFDEDPEIEVVEEDAEKNRFIYTSMNYRFTCDVRLSKSVVSTFADMFESTYNYCRALPLAITGGQMTDGKYDILLFETKESYIQAGGPPSSSGVFMSRGKSSVVMVPLTSLGVRKVGSGYMRDRDKSDGTLIHEITHQLTPNAYFSVGSRGWFSEGIAEYTTATPYRYGKFKVKNNFDDIEEYLTAYGKSGNGGRAMGDDFKAPALRDFMMMDYADFTGGNANFNYGFALFLTTYFLHIDGEGDAARIKEFLKELRKLGLGRGSFAIKNGESPDQAMARVRAEDQKKVEGALAKLLDGRTWDELEADISKGWGRKGIDVEFAEPKGSY